MFRKIFKFLYNLFLFVSGVGVFFLFLPRLITEVTTRSKIYTTESVPENPVAIVFGAGLRRDGYPTAVLRDRVTTAVKLYFEGKVEFLLMSGDNQTEDYDEPTAMYNYAVQLGVPTSAIVRDYAGRRTYDTCYRAREIFGVKEAVLVSQEFHLPRALYTCQALGVDVYGVPADVRSYWKRAQVYWNIRELPATVVALWDIHVSRPLPILGDPEPILLRAQ